MCKQFKNDSPNIEDKNSGRPVASAALSRGLLSYRGVTEQNKDELYKMKL